MDFPGKNSEATRAVMDELDMPQPLITCIMPTYNRLRQREDGSVDAVLLEEAIESFNRQTYKNRELLIINDTPGQTLSIDPSYANIHIVNQPQRAESLGHKYRYAIERAAGEYITPWDDDDVMLSHRLVTCWQHVRGADVLIVHGLYSYDQKGTMNFSPHNGFAADWYRRSLAEREGYSLTSFGSDAESRKKFKRAADSHHVLSPNKDWHFYIYRWYNTGRPHLSGRGIQSYAMIGRIPIFETHYELKPHWSRDYEAEVREYRDRSQPEINS